MEGRSSQGCIPPFHEVKTLPAPQPSLEIDLAVARGDTYLHRARFRPSTILTVGSNPMTTITLRGDDVPDFHELLRLTEDGVILRFTPDIRVEVLQGPGQILGTDVLISRGFARPSGEGYAMALPEGGKAVVRLGSHKLMLRVEPGTGTATRQAKVGGEVAKCPSCGRQQPLALIAGGAITVCDGCGAWTQFARPGGPQGAIEDSSTQIGVSPSLKIAPGAPSKAAVAASEDILGADLPTFDAIQAFKEDEGMRTVDAVRVLRSDGGSPAAPAPRGKSGSITGSRPTVGGGGAPTAPPSDRASDLPTFDAISAIREDGMSTMDAVQALRGDAPPPRKEETAGRPGRPVNIADMVRKLEPEVGPPPAAAPGRRPVPSPPIAEPATSPHPAPPAKALESGHWEETLTIQAVRPKKRATTLYIGIAALTLGMTAAFIIILVMRHFGWLAI